MKKLLTACLVILLACVLSFALADEAKEITEGITYESNAKSDEFANMRDDDFNTYFPQFLSCILGVLICSQDSF